MTSRSRVFAGLILCLGFMCLPAARAQESERAFRLQPGIGFEYVSRSLVWDENTKASLLKAGLFQFRFGIELPGGAAFSVLLGYGLNDWNGLVFRKLPFSIDYQAGSIGAVLFGAEIEVPLLKPGDWEIGASGRFQASIGSAKEWAVSDLNQAGALDGRADWMRIQAGPTLTYRGFEAFSPFLRLVYDRLWGNFTLNEKIETLSGSEEKKIKGQGAVGGSFGMIYDPSSILRLKAEGSLLPYKKIAGGLGFDFGATLQVLVSF